MMFIKDHQSLLMCNKCYGLLRNDMSEYYTHNYDNNITLCNCENKNRAMAFNIDKNIFEIIQRLNQKGYKTIACCEGHGKEGLSIGYEKISIKEVDRSNIPEGFTMTNRGILGTKEYSSPTEKRKDYKRLLNWIESDLKERN